MEILVPFLSLVGWILCFVGTADQFYKRGHSQVLGLVVGGFLGPIGLVISCFVPYDRDALAERKLRQEQAERIRIEQNIRFGNLRKCPHCGEAISSRVNACSYCGNSVEPIFVEKPKLVKPKKELKDGEPRNPGLSVVSGITLVFGPILMVLFQSSDLTLFFGLASIAGLIGLVFSNWPKKIGGNSL